MGGALRSSTSIKRWPGADDAREAEPRLIVKTRCVLVADVIAVDRNGRQEALATGLREDAARELFAEIMGRPWTSAEIAPSMAAERAVSPGPVAVDGPSEARRRSLRLPRRLRRSSGAAARENAA